MNTKLTLKLDKGIIERATESLPPKVRKLSGILKSKDMDYKKVLEKQLRKNTLN